MAHAPASSLARRALTFLALAIVLAPARASAQDPPPPTPQEEEELKQPPLQDPAQAKPSAPELPPSEPQDVPAPRPPVERPKVLSIRIEGEERYTEAQLMAALGQAIGAHYDPAAVDAGVRQLWSSFHVHADVLLREVEGGVELRLVVRELPVDREPRFIGNAEIDDDTLRRWALIEDRTELYLHQARRVRQRLLEGYAREGFYFVEVNIVTRGGEEDSAAPAAQEPPAAGDPAAGEQAAADAQARAALPDVIFEIREGPKVRVKGVEIRGNVSMPDERFLYFFKSGLSQLAKRELHGRTLLSWRGSAFVQETLDADLLAMRNVYRDRGWLDAVVELERLEFDAERERVTIHILVDEGPIYRVSSLQVRAFEWRKPERPSDLELDPAELVFPEARLLELCSLDAGERLEKTTQKKDEAALRNFYGKHGYLTHESLPRQLDWEFLEPELVFDVEHRTVAVTYRVVQGKQVTIREILFSGTHHTRDRVLRRELTVFPGQRADLEQIQQSLSRIHATGYFDDPYDRLEHKPPTYRFLPVEDEPAAVDLQYEVDEGRVVDFNIQGGVDSNQGAFGGVSLTMRNFDLFDTPSSFWGAFSEVYHKEAFHGAGQRFDIELTPGTEVTRFRLHFLEPDLFQRHLRPISLDVDLQKRLRSYETHEEDRFERRLKFGRKLTHDMGVWLGIVYADLEVHDLDSGGVPPSLVAQEALGDTVLSGVTLDFTKRDLDNLVVPHDGYNLRLNNVVNSEAVGSDFEFVDSEVHVDWYRPAGQRSDGSQVTLHVGFDAGVAQPYGNTVDVPYSERFQLGGTGNLRGFDYRGVGPDDPGSGFPLGGETYLSGSAELQIPLHSTLQPGTYQRQEILRGVLFLDWGVLDPEAFVLDPDELRCSAGFGIGLAYPLPLILNFGFPVRWYDTDELQVFSFSLGLR